MSWTLDGRPVRRVLVTRLRYLGDIAMATVVPAALRRGDPGLELGFLCEAAYAPLLTGQPDLTRVHALGARRRGPDAAARRAGHDGGETGRAGGTLAMVRELRDARYDLAVDLFFNPRSAWLLRLAGIPARIGGATSASRRWLYTHRATAPPIAERPRFHAAAGGGLGEHLGRLGPLRHGDGRPFLDWFEDMVPPGTAAPRVARPPLGPRLRAMLAGLGARPGGYLLLAPAATWPAKEWPAEHWRTLAALLADAGRIVVVLSPPGGPGRWAPLAAAIPGGCGGLLAPLPLADALAVVGAARALVSVDGGVMHAAVAMGIPTVALFGPTDPAIWFPYGELGPYRVLAIRPHCHPCDRHSCDRFVCLPDLAPARVFDAVAAIVADVRGGA
ncbi:MAG TPA: glycosyltransferase family 9 protein [Candidatus Krumholzibacteria bacterium]|nr:glycosyltransferase family 9 protein [Candidatus Krumholzibacteria bacterium]HPD71732.1 glycosyltransferase family 9 protein [Candidatus Krumholzibacteria bacterium]HRY41335.1 glycosyltransferase family 9 protein [Candidatus Krumholzibacteria bacterium]